MSDQSNSAQGKDQNELMSQIQKLKARLNKKKPTQPPPAPVAVESGAAAESAAKPEETDVASQISAAKARMKSMQREGADVEPVRQKPADDQMASQVEKLRARMKNIQQTGDESAKPIAEDTADERTVTQEKSEEQSAAEGPDDAEPEPAIIFLKPSSDGMLLELVFQKAVDAPTIPPTYEDVVRVMEENKITHGIDEESIGIACGNPLYNRPYVIAAGKEPRTGADGYLEYLVETSRELRPKIREDGTADFRDIGFIQLVRKGQVLCKIHKPEKGEDGYDIYGNVREGRYGKEPANPAGKNTTTNEEGHLISICDGSADVKRGIIDVVDVMHIRGNVDNATGDVHFIGDVIVEGDVVSGFTVSTQGSITVKGSVEDANVQATGDIVVGQGINGTDHGSVIADGSIKCQYIQSCYIKSGGDIYADSIMHCKVECGGNVELAGKRGTLIGGESLIGGELICNRIGSESHIATYVTLAGGSMERDREIKRLEGKLAAIDEESRKMLQTMAHIDDLIKKKRAGQEVAKKALDAKNAYVAKMRERTEAQRMLEQVKKEQLAAGREMSQIKCKGRVHVGTSITFGPLTMSVKTSFVNSRVFILEDKLKVSPL